jgi:hypothetical protein
MGVDPRERDHFPVIEAGFDLAPGQQKNIGSIPCRQLRKLTATVRASYSQSADVTKPLVIETFWSADGQHHDTNSYASIFLPAAMSQLQRWDFWRSKSPTRTPTRSAT